MSFTERTEILIGKLGIEKLQSSNVAVFGVGGVGGYTCEMLVRAGIGEITIIDFDTVAMSNINRQIIALTSTVGKLKVDVFKNRLLDINPNLRVNVFPIKFCEDNIDLVFSKHYDYVVDAIDDLDNKILLIKTCHDKNIEIVSAMGAGNRCDIPVFEVADVYKTYNDGLAKLIRKRLRSVGVEKHNVVFTKSVSQPKSHIVGSISYYPSMCGCTLSAFVINELLKGIVDND